MNVKPGEIPASPLFKYEITSVTPSAAASWLTTNTHHRANAMTVKNYAKAMEQGSWKLNGEPIIFSDKNVLLDGFARLRACVKSNKSFKTLIVHGIDGANFETIDAVRKRTLGDILHIRREPNGRQLASALMIVWRYRQGDIGTQIKSPATGDLLALLDGTPAIRDVSIPVALDAAPDLPLGVGIALHHLFSLVDAEQANEFFQQFVDGAAATPPGVLRTSLQEMAAQGGRRVQTTIIAFAIKAWNAFREQRSITLLRHNSDREKFPEISGLETPAVSEDTGEELSLFSFPQDNDGDALKVKVQEVTPEFAALLLRDNKGNRLVASGVVAKYKRDMAAGRWLMNGQTIKIAKNGRLLDGQHRCSACVQSGVPFPAIIVRDVDESVFDTFDLGGRRSFSDVLKQRGEKSTAALAAGLRWLWMHKEQKIFDRVTAPTNSELDETFRVNPSISQSLKLTNKVRNVMAPGMGVALHYLFSQKDYDVAEEFFDRVCDGQNLTNKMPVWHIRERLINDRGGRKVRMAESERFALTVKAWNAVRQNKQISQLSWRSKGPGRETMPEII